MRVRAAKRKRGGQAVAPRGRDLAETLRSERLVFGVFGGAADRMAGGRNVAADAGDGVAAGDPQGGGGGGENDDGAHLGTNPLSFRWSR